MRAVHSQRPSGPAGDATLGGHLLEAQPRCGVSRRDAGDLFPSADCDIDVKRVEFDQPCDSAGALGGENSRAAAAEWIENDAVALAAVANEIGNQCDGLHRRMQREVASTGRMKAVDARITTAAMLALYARVITEPVDDSDDEIQADELQILQRFAPRLLNSPRAKMKKSSR